MISETALSKYAPSVYAFSAFFKNSDLLNNPIVGVMIGVLVTVLVQVLCVLS